MPMNKYIREALIYIYIIFYLAAIYEFGWMGFWVGFSISICFVIIRIVLSWKDFKQQLEYMESIIFGAPLNKEEWSDKKPQLPKVKWKKEK